MTPTKPTVFIASSGKAVPMVDALVHVLKKANLSCKPWLTPALFAGYVLPDLLHAAAQCDYAVFVMWADDELKAPMSDNKSEITRDNVIFEVGLFAGALNPALWKGDVSSHKRIFLWINKQHSNLHIPTDLTGLAQNRYQFDGDLESTNHLKIIEQIEAEALVLASQINQHWTARGRENAGGDNLNTSLLNCFKREWTTPPPHPPPPTYKPNQILLDDDDVYDSFVASRGTPREGVAIINADTRWIWDLFPIILYWRFNGIPVNVVADKIKKNHDEEERRRRLIKNLGCSFLEASVKERLLVLNPNKAANTIVFKYENEKHCCAVRATRENESELVELVDQELLAYGLHFEQRDGCPKIVQCNESEIIAKLKSSHGPAPYLSNSVEMHMEDVILKNAFSISTSARTYRFRQTQLLFDLFNVCSIPLFEPAKIQFDNGETSLITPPVVEKWGENYVFIEGNTRALYSYCKGLKTIKCLVATGVTTDLPANQIPIPDVFLCRLKLPAAWRQRDWNYYAFRNIEAAIHNFQV